MKRIKYIAKNELYALFFSPIAWIMMIIFIIMTSAAYLGVLDGMVGIFQRGGPGLMDMEYLTSEMTTKNRTSFIRGVIDNLYIFLPLITMGLISREVSSGTIRLLQSSPLRIREIILGKFLAMLVFIGCLLALLGLILVPFCIELFHPDYGQLAASLFGLFMILASYAAAGLFISSLTSYQIVAAIATFGLFLALQNIGRSFQDIDVIRDITWYLNINEKSYNFVHGLLNLRDFFYFLIIIGSLLLFTIIRIKSGMESISWWKKARRYLAVIAIAFVVAYITTIPKLNAYFDSTRNEILTITPPTRAMLAKLDDGPLEITAYSNLFEGYGNFSPIWQNYIIHEVWDPYIRFKPDIHLKFIYYYDADSSNYRFKINPGKTLKEIAQKETKASRINLKHFLAPEEVSRLVDTKAEELRSFFVLHYKGKSTILRTFNDQFFWPTEDEISAAINRLVGTAPKVDFVQGEIERGPFSERDRDYKGMASRVYARDALINAGYDFDTLSLKDKEIPAGLAALMIADPRTPMTPDELGKINRYIDGGDNLFIVTEPDRREITKPILDKLGLSLRSGMLIQPSSNYSSDLVFPYLTDTGKNMSPQFARELSDDLRYFGDPLFRIGLAGASVLEYQGKDGFTIEPLLRTDKDLSWNRVAPVNIDSLQLKVRRLPSDEPGSYVTAVRMHRKINGKEQRIIVATDADYITEPQLYGGNPSRFNFDFGLWCFSYFSYGQFPTNTLLPLSIDNGFSITVDNIPKQKIIFYWVIPALIVALASVLLIRRKRK